MSDLLLIAAVFVLGLIVGYRLARADMAAWARQSARRDVQRRGLAAMGPIGPAEYRRLEGLPRRAPAAREPRRAGR